MPPQTISQLPRYSAPSSFEYTNDHFSQYNLSKNTPPSAGNDVNWQQRPPFARNKILPHQTVNINFLSSIIYMRYSGDDSSEYLPKNANS